MNSPAASPSAIGSEQIFQLLLLSLAVAFTLGLFNHGLVPSMEPRFAEVTREMLATGEWLVPIKNGRPYVEYPPFYYWLSMLLHLTGLPIVAAIRLPSYVAFFAWVYLLKRWQDLIAPDLNPYAFAVAGAAMPLALFQFSIAQTDGLLVLGVMLSVYGYTRHKSASPPSGFPWLVWLGVALATSAKGPVGIACTLPVFVLDGAIAGLAAEGGSSGSGAWRSLAGMARQVLSIGWLRGMAMVLIVTVPWYVVTGLSMGWEFVQAVLTYQNFDRYLTGYSHSQPWWYYFKTIIYDFFPASLLIPAAVYFAARQLKRQHVRLALVWALYTLAFFSFSGSKQGKYMLPAAPAFVALSFVAIAELRQRSRVDLWYWFKRWYVAIILLWVIVVTLILPFFSDQIGGRDGFVPIREQIAAEPGRLYHFQWPRSLTLYELGAPMPFLRSARELYRRIHDGEIVPGDYVLARKSDLGENATADSSARLIPYPNDSYFEEVLVTEIEKSVVLIRVIPGAATAEIPPTPNPPTLFWRDEMFDTD
jgi:4-amino-4-deoxy-L-arabinose transferase-like glycosyltransferase